MLKKENPISEKRCKFLMKCMDLGVSSDTKVELVKCMAGKTDEEKEELAKKLLEIISTSSSEKEMVELARKLK